MTNAHNGPVGDMLSFLVVIGVAASWLPNLAALMAILWTAIRIFEWVRFRVIDKKPEEFK